MSDRGRNAHVTTVSSAGPARGPSGGDGRRVPCGAHRAVTPRGVRSPPTVTSSTGPAVTARVQDRTSPARSSRAVCARSASSPGRARSGGAEIRTSPPAARSSDAVQSGCAECCTRAAAGRGAAAGWPVRRRADHRRGVRGGRGCGLPAERTRGRPAGAERARHPARRRRGAAFTGMAIACLVLARRFAALRSWGWVAASIATAVSAEVIASWPGDGISVRLVVASAILFAYLTALSHSGHLRRRERVACYGKPVLRGRSSQGPRTRPCRPRHTHGSTTHRLRR